MDTRFAAFQAIDRADNAEKHLDHFIERMNSMVNSFCVKRLKYTGWFVLLRRADTRCGFEFAGIFSPDESPEDSEPQWDYALPIPSSDSIPEFLGW